MAVSQAQIVDLLYKQAFGVTKTDTSTNKSPSNESIPSPLLNRGDTLWTQADQIPEIAAAVANVVQAYEGVDAVECTADNTTVPIGGVYPTWLTNLTYWIPSEFGSTYTAKVYVDNPGAADPVSTGTQIFAAGSGGNGQFYFNYQSGVLNFIGETIPAALTSGKTLYIVGFRYIGLTGVTSLPSNTTIGNLNFTGSNISSVDTNGNINLTPNGTGVVVSSANISAPYFLGNFAGNISGNFTAAGSNKGVAYNDNGIYNTTQAMTFDKVSNAVVLTGNLSAANANLGNLVIANFVTAGEWYNGNSNVRIAANGNLGISITGIPNVLLVTDTGAVLTGQLNANSILSGNITSNANVITDYLTTRTGNLVISSGTGANSIYLVAGNVIDAGNVPIANIGGPIDAQDAATKEYVDNAVSAGLNIHTAVYVATPSALTATYADGGTSLTVTSITDAQTLVTSTPHGLVENELVVFSTSTNGITAGTPYFVYTVPSSTEFTVSLTYSGPEIVTLTNGTGLTIGGLANAGVGATLTNSGTQVALSIDNVALSVGQRVLVKNQVTQAQNGIYEVTDIGSGSSNWILTRTTDTDTYIPNSPSGMSEGDYFFVQAGDTGAGDSFVNNVVGAIEFGTTSITFAQFSESGVYTAGTGLGLDGTEFFIANTLVTPASYGNSDRIASFTVNQQGQLTAASDVVIQANAANLSGTTLNANIVNSSLTSVGNLTVANVTGNLIANNIESNANLSAVTANFSGNLTALNASLGNLATANYVNVANDVNIVQNLNGNVANFSGNLTALNANLGNLATANFVNVASNITTSNLSINLELSGNTANFTGNIAPLGILTDGYYYANGSPVDFQQAAGSNTQIQFNDNNDFGANANFTYDWTYAGGNGLLDVGYASNGTIQTGTVNAAHSIHSDANISATTDISAGGELTVTGNANITLDVNVTANLTANNANITNILNGNVANFIGNLTALNANLGNLATANYVNVSSNVTSNNVTVNLELSGNTANFIGNITSLNANLGNLATANFVNVSSNTTTNNLTVNLELSGNTANFIGNVTTLNANLGNLATANFVNVSSNVNVALNLNGNTANFIGNITSLNANLGNLVEANFVNVASNTITNNLTVNLELSGNTANFTTGVTVDTLTANVANIAENIILGNTLIYWATETTTSTSGGQTIASFLLNGTDVVGAEFLVKGVDSTGSKYSVATVQAVTNGSTVDYSTYGTVNLGGSTGLLSATIVVNGADPYLELQVTPSSSNSTVWTTQFRLI